MSFKTVLVKNSSPLCRKNAKNRAVFPNSTLSPSPKFAARPSDLPPPPLSFPDQIQYGVSLSLSLSLRKQRRTGPFFSSQVSEINFPFLGWTENGKARRGKINPTSLSLSTSEERKRCPLPRFPPSENPHGPYSVFVWYSSVCGNLLIIFRSSLRPRGGQREGVIVDTTRGIHVGASVRCHDVYVGRACNSNNCPESIGGGGECSGRVFNDVLTCQCLPTFIRT